MGQFSQARWGHGVCQDATRSAMGLEDDAGWCSINARSEPRGAMSLTGQSRTS